MSNKHKYILIFFSLILLFSFRSYLKNNIVYVQFKSNDLEVKYLKEGLLLSGTYKNKYFVDFIKTQQLNLNKLQALDDFIQRKNVWQMDSIYKNKDNVLSSTSVSFLFINSNEQSKKIIYHNCYNPIVDSLMVYLNDIIPMSKKKQYNLAKYRYQQAVFIDCLSK